MEQAYLPEEFVERIAGLSKVCPHFHLSLQSGCDETLKRMNRKYSAEEYYEVCKRLRRHYENPALTTDVIVGFAQETEEEFAQTKDFLEKISFYEMHIFKYSKRKGTIAAGLPGQVPDEVKTRRSNILLELEKQQSKAFRAHYVGKEAEVLFEETKNIGGVDYQIGHTKDYVKVALLTEENLTNKIRNVKISGFLTDEILV